MKYCRRLPVLYCAVLFLALATLPNYSDVRPLRDGGSALNDLNEDSLCFWQARVVG